MNEPANHKEALDHIRAYATLYPARAREEDEINWMQAAVLVLWVRRWEAQQEPTVKPASLIV